MIKYRGQYRVIYETDKQGKACEFAYIPCGIMRGCNICRHSDNTLNVNIPSIRTANRLLKEYPEIFKPFQVGDNEASLLFQESDMDKAATILKVRVKGKNQSPKPKRKCNLTKKQRQAIGERLAIARKQNLHRRKTPLDEKLAVFCEGNINYRSPLFYGANTPVYISLSH